MHSEIAADIMSNSLSLSVTNEARCEVHELDRDGVGPHGNSRNIVNNAARKRRFAGCLSRDWLSPDKEHACGERHLVTLSREWFENLENSFWYVVAVIAGEMEWRGEDF